MRFTTDIDSVNGACECIIPSYALLSKTEWVTLSNIFYDNVTFSFKEIYWQHKDNSIFKIANETLLSILAAFDESQKEMLVQTAKQLSVWLLEECPDEVIDKQVRYINYLQAVKRVQLLDENERNYLFEILEDATTTKFVKISANLLLDNYRVAKWQLDNKLDPTEQEGFRSWPIYNLFKYGC